MHYYETLLTPVIEKLDLILMDLHVLSALVPNLYYTTLYLENWQNISGLSYQSFWGHKEFLILSFKLVFHMFLVDYICFCVEVLRVTGKETNQQSNQLTPKKIGLLRHFWSLLSSKQQVIISLGWLLFELYFIFVLCSLKLISLTILNLKYNSKQLLFYDILS